MAYRISKADRSIKAKIRLDGSKSISNRALIIRALSGLDFEISHLSNSKDTTTLQSLLKSDDEILDAGAAGTTFRFLTAYLSLKEGAQILTGSERMKQRPIGVLVEALRSLGANIEYLEKEGYPPLRINTPNIGKQNRLAISANVSSQYISALLMIGPVLPGGIELELATNIVSRPYIEMTLNLMSYFGIKYSWVNNLIKVLPQQYQGKAYRVEADWSAASYYYALATFAEELDLQLDSLWEDSVQGDAILSEMMTAFGIKSTFNQTGVHLTKSINAELPECFSWDFIRCPDIAQTLAVICAGTGVRGLFTGLETLRIKETDRIKALQQELSKVGVNFSLYKKEAQDQQEFFEVKGMAKVNEPVFATYEDHRMAMAFAPLAMFAPVNIEEPMVVVKSYPAFWEDLEQLAFEVER